MKATRTVAVALLICAAVAAACSDSTAPDTAAPGDRRNENSGLFGSGHKNEPDSTTSNGAAAPDSTKA
jgi:hypothetical protein